MANTKIDVKPSDDGKTISLTITEAPKAPLMISLAAQLAGEFATGLLATAIDCARRSGAAARLEQCEPGPFLPAHEVSLGDALADPDTIVLGFAIGATTLSIGVPRNGAAQMGSGLLAARQRPAGERARGSARTG